MLELQRARFNQLREEQVNAPDFWNDASGAQAVMQRASLLRASLDEWRALERLAGDCDTLIELALESGDDALAKEVDPEIEKLSTLAETMETETLLSDPDDPRNAMLVVHAGAGGTEAQDWTEMLLRMYTRWAERHGFKLAMLDQQEGEGAGIKSATLSVEGRFSYGFLKAENGVHRLVRISPYDANARRHTSFASVFVYPEIDDEVEIEIKSDDLKIDTFRSGGKGGQNVNKVETAVRITHVPSGVIVACQQERSQFQNRERAMKMLKSRLYQLRREEEQARKAEVEKTKKRIEWGSQIRSYVFQPYTLVKDHRTDYSETDVQKVMDGQIDGFLKAYLAEVAKQ